MNLQIQTEEYPTAFIEHNGEILEFDLSVYNKRALINNDICTLINAYWASLPGFQQQQIFAAMAQIRQTFELVSETSPLMHALIPQVKALYDLHNLDQIHQWVSLRTDVNIPSRFDALYEQTDERPFTRERTYTRSDYLSLVSLALTLRPMMPIWGHFIMRTIKDVGNDFKEYTAFQLLAQTYLMDSVPMQKLLVYIKGNLQEKKIPTNVLVHGVPAEDYPMLLLGSVAVRRICVGDLRGIEQTANLVVAIHSDLTQKNHPTNSSSFGEFIRDKPFEGDDRNEQGISRVENYKIKAMHSIGEIEAIKHYMRNPYVVGQQLMPQMDMQLLSRLLEAANPLQTAQIWPGQIGLLQWVINPVVSARGIYHLDKISTIRALAVAQTWLWQRGHKQLACLLTALKNDTSQAFSTIGTGSMAHIGEYAEKLEALFPYNYVSVKRKKTTPTNRAVVAIEALAEEFHSRDWIITLPDDLAQEITGRRHQRTYTCPHEIRQLLAKLAIECASRDHAPNSYLDKAKQLPTDKEQLKRLIRSMSDSAAQQLNGAELRSVSNPGF